MWSCWSCSCFFWQNQCSLCPPLKQTERQTEREILLCANMLNKIWTMAFPETSDQWVVKCLRNKRINCVLTHPALLHTTQGNLQVSFTVSSFFQLEVCVLRSASALVVQVGQAVRCADNTKILVTKNQEVKYSAGRESSWFLIAHIAICINEVKIRWKCFFPYCTEAKAIALSYSSPKSWGPQRLSNDTTFLVIVFFQFVYMLSIVLPQHLCGCWCYIWVFWNDL